MIKIFPHLLYLPVVGISLLCFDLSKVSSPLPIWGTLQLPLQYTFPFFHNKRILNDHMATWYSGSSGPVFLQVGVAMSPSSGHWLVNGSEICNSQLVLLKEGSILSLVSSLLLSVARMAKWWWELEQLSWTTTGKLRVGDCSQNPGGWVGAEKSCPTNLCLSMKRKEYC